MRLTTVLTVAVLMSGCSNPTYYQGLGRPEYKAPPRRLPLSIVEAYVTDLDVTKRFALLVNEGTVAASGLTLAGPTGSVKIEGSIPAGGELQVSLASLPGSGVYGELAATSADGLVQAYLAWGADPFAAGSLLAAAAYQSGAIGYGEYVPSGFPAPIGSAFVSTAAGVGCAPPSDTVAGLVRPVLCPPTTAGVVALRGIVPALDGATDSQVTLRNLSTAPVDLFGVRLCQTAGCTTITTDVVVAAGSTQVLHVGATTATTTDPVIPGAPIAAESELAVLAPGTDLTTTLATFQSYALWGSVAPSFADAATTAGLWPARDAQGNVRAAEAMRVPGEILVPVADAALPPPAWAPAAPEKTDPATLPIGPTNNLWTTCSAPRRWGPQPKSTLVLSAIEAADATHGARLHFTNRDASTGPAVALTAITIDVVTDDQSTTPTTITRTLSATAFGNNPVMTDLAPGSTLVVELATTCPVTSGSPCLAGPTLTAGGELALRVNGAMGQYVAWGTTPNQAGTAPQVSRRTFATEALAANLWPGTRNNSGHDRDCAVVLPAAGSTLSLDLALDGRSPPDWQ